MVWEAGLHYAAWGIYRQDSAQWVRLIGSFLKILLFLQPGTTSYPYENRVGNNKEFPGLTY